MAVEITLEGEIGWEIDAWLVKNALREAKGEDIRVIWSSPGGTVFQGITIFNLFKNYPGKVEFHIVGLAASMGSYIPLAADKVTAERNAVFMIHNARSYASGDHNVMLKRAALLEGLSNLLAKQYVVTTGRGLEDIKSEMDAETWFFGDEILTAGFVSAMTGDADPDANARSIYTATAKETFEACMGRVKDEAPDDYERAAALIDVDNVVNICDNTDIDDSTPAHADITNTQEGSFMDLKEYREKNPDGSALIDKLVADAKEAGRKEAEEKHKALITQASAVLNAETPYPKAVQAVALKALNGETSPDALTATIAVFDAQKETEASTAAAAETAGQPDTPAPDKAPVKTDDAVAQTDEDIDKLIAADKGV